MLANRTTINDQLNRTFCLKNTSAHSNNGLPYHCIRFTVFHIMMAFLIFSLLSKNITYFYNDLLETFIENYILHFITTILLLALK